MAHVTFIHGIANKPPEADLLRIWREALANCADPLPLGDYGVTSSLVYWADLMYEKPDEDSRRYEGVLENRVEAVDGSGGARPPVPRTAEEAAFLEKLRSHLTGMSDAEIAAGAPAVPPNPQGALERVPLPWFLKKPIMDVLLRDVHHYLFDVEFAPPGRAAVHIQQTIRRRFVDKLGAAEITGPHVVVSHSMGTVIAYDCLKRVADCAGVDGLITLGSPLGLDEIQDKLQPGWHATAAFRRSAWRAAGSTSSIGSIRCAASIRSSAMTTADRAPAWSKTSQCRTPAPGATRSPSTCASRTSAGCCAKCCSCSAA